MEKAGNKGTVEIWGGVECTVVRVKDQVHDQLELSGHENRPEDLQLMAELGIKTVRYPLLWEKFEAGRENFLQMHRQRLKYLTELGITPVAGLLHHGSGPFSTDLADQAFPEKLADYAGIIAEAFPWIKYYTPVNEPLTTARFSGLYGIWYPHQSSDLAFIRMFLNEMKGIILSVKRVRKINPQAELVQTEDLCRIHSTPELSYQADFENERRWLTYDILSGLFGPDHPMWRYMKECGVKEKELEFFIGEPDFPKIFGFNYYVTSERYLDQRLEKYPVKKHGGNSFQQYADVECVRVDEEPEGFYNLLREAWDRYHFPMILSEVHLGCTREEQMRWFYEAWTTGNKLRDEGVDFRAVTGWSFLGSYGWDSLLLNDISHYESGIYDISSGDPRPTALAGLIRLLNRNREPSDLVIKVPGWWKRDLRVIYPDNSKRNKPKNHQMKQSDIFKNAAPLMITGAGGALGKAIEKICHTRGIVSYSTDRSQMDITSEASILENIKRIKPWAVINAAGYSSIDNAELEPLRCFRENTMGAIVLARICAREGVGLVTFSTDQVFNGRKRNPYLEKDITAPLNTYGLSKRMAEERILENNPETLIIRSSSFFNPWNEKDRLVSLLTGGMTEKITSPVYFASDIIFSPAYVPEIVNVALNLLLDGENGIWHLSSTEGLSEFEFSKLAFRVAGLNDDLILPITMNQMKYAAERPSYSVLMSSRGIILPPLEGLLYHFIDELKFSLSTSAGV